MAHNKQKKSSKEFRSEDEERRYWQELDLNESFSESDFREVSFPELKPSSQSISLRIPKHLLARVKERANRDNVPYQSLLKEYIERGVQEEGK